MRFRREYRYEPDISRVLSEFIQAFGSAGGGMRVTLVEKNRKWVVMIHAENFDEHDAQYVTSNSRWTRAK